MAENNPERDRILARLRSAPRNPQDSTEAPPQVFPSIPDVRERFLKECTINLTEVIETRDCVESLAAFERVLESIPEGDIFFQEADVFRNWASRVGPAHPARWSSDGPPLETTEATFTLAHAFVAQTGSILVSSLCGGRGATIVPACHVVFGKRSQLIPDIESAMRIAERELLGASFVGLISGSSRTADIEKILVQGAHGPRRVVIILQEQD